MKGNFFLGVDIGSSYSKGCLLDENANVVADTVRETEIDFRESGRNVVNDICKRAEIDQKEISLIVSTGVGRDALGFVDFSKTEISCLLKGSLFYFPHKSTIIDIGAQDIKIVKVDETRDKVSFKMNRKCAAGTGAFLDEISRKLRVPLNRLNEMARNTSETVSISSFCTVFAATEIIHLLRTGIDIQKIARGIYESLVDRALSIETVENSLILSGGVVEHNSVVVEIFEEKTGFKPFVPQRPQLLAAFGAALFALQGGKR